MSENIEEFVEEHRNVIIKFSSYYKHSFVYKGVTNDGTIIRLIEECDSDEVFEKEVDAESEYTLEFFLKQFGLRITNLFKDEDSIPPVIFAYLMQD